MLMDYISGRTGLGEHFDFAQGRGFVLGDTLGEFDFRHFGHLVCLAVRPQARRRSSHLDQMVDIRLKLILKEQQRRGEDF